MEKYRKKKRTESQQLNSSMQDDPTKEIKNKQVKENNAKQKRALAKELSRRFCEKKHLNVLKSVHLWFMIHKFLDLHMKIHHLY